MKINWSAGGGWSEPSPKSLPVPRREDPEVRTRVKPFASHADPNGWDEGRGKRVDDKVPDFQERKQKSPAKSK